MQGGRRKLFRTFINNSDRDVSSVFYYESLFNLVIAIINVWATPFSSAHLAFGSHKQKDFTHNSCEYER